MIISEALIDKKCYSTDGTMVDRDPVTEYLRRINESIEETARSGMKSFLKSIYKLTLLVIVVMMVIAATGCTITLDLRPETITEQSY